MIGIGIISFVCISIHTNVGPMEDPIILNDLLTPKDIPINLIGVDVVLILICPIFNKGKPDPITARYISSCIA